jgi:hypothetical protein
VGDGHQSMDFCMKLPRGSKPTGEVEINQFQQSVDRYHFSLWLFNSCAKRINMANLYMTYDDKSRFKIVFPVRKPLNDQWVTPKSSSSSSPSSSSSSNLCRQ